MKTFLFMCLSILVWVSPVLAQSALPICNEDAGLQWEVGAETDLAKFTLYHGPTAGVLPGGTGVVTEDIAYDPNVGDVVEYPIALPQGDRFFVVTASDVAGNEGDLSNEVGCVVDLKPETLHIILRFELPTP